MHIASTCFSIGKLKELSCAFGLECGESYGVSQFLQAVKSCILFSKNILISQNVMTHLLSHGVR